MNVRPVAVVVGAQGQLGSALVDSLASDHAIVAFSRRELDVTDHEAVMRCLVGAAPTVILNAVAYNNVDAAEDDAMTALDVNAMALRGLARARPYVEDNPPSPRSVYGQSKLVGEWMAASIHSHYVLRVESLFGGTSARSTIDKLIDAIRRGGEVRAFHDREVSPSFIDDVVMATRELLARSAPFGTYHCVNSGHDSWAAVAEEAATRLGVADPKLLRVSVSDVPLRASRPRYAALDNSKLKTIGVAMPHWRDALARHIARIRSGDPQ
jgi:dTDP-4-dehydrorhamnose reductase